MRLIVLSGGQTGADRAGLVAASNKGIPTGGWSPRGWLTEDGPDPSLAAYGLRETASTSYPARTRANVRDADACVWFGDPSSPGGRLTLRECESRGVPVFVVMDGVTPVLPALGVGVTPRALADWLRGLGRDEVRLLVAGNRESKAPGIFLAACAFLTLAFEELGVK